jgi:hypothetical protein
MLHKRKLRFYFNLGLINYAVNNQTVQRRMIGWLIKMNWNGYGWKWPQLNLRNYPTICLERSKKTTKELGQHSRSPGRYLKSGPPDHEARELTTRPWHSVRNLVTSTSHTTRLRKWYQGGYDGIDIRLGRERINANKIFVSLLESGYLGNREEDRA